MSEILIIGVLAAILALIAGYVYIKDSDANRKFARYEKVMEALVQENHAIKKRLEQIATRNLNDAENIDVEALEERILSKIDSRVNSKIIPVFNTLQSLENSIDSFQSEQQDKLFSIEERTKSIGKITPDENNDESRILAMYQSGKSKETIAKDLRIGVGKVEFVLKFHGIL